MPPLVSIVVPVFNGMPYLRDLVPSIVNQTYQELEIIFCEGGGTDDSLEFLHTLNDSRVSIIRMPAGTTAASNWTAATEAASGTYIKLICQDDLLNLDAVEKQVQDLEYAPSAVMAIAQRDIVDADGKIVYQRRGCSGLKTGLMPGDEMLRATYLQGMNIIGEPVVVMFRREPLLNAMPWDGSNPLMLDITCYQKVATDRDIFVRKESIGAFRVSTSSWSTRLAKVQLMQFRSWQHEFVTAHNQDISSIKRMQAFGNVHFQTVVRRTAYAVLRLRGSFKSKA